MSMNGGGGHEQAVMDLDALQASLKAHEKNFELFAQMQAKTLASQIAAKESLRENEKKLQVAKFKAPGNKRSYELMMVLQHLMEDVESSWNDVLPDQVLDNDSAEVFLMNNPDRSSAIAKAITATSVALAEMMQKVKHERKMIEAASVSSEGWRVVKYLEEGSGNFAEDDEEMTERLREAEVKCRRADNAKRLAQAAQNKKKNFNKMFTKNGSFKTRDMFVARSGDKSEVRTVRMIPTEKSPKINNGCFVCGELGHIAKSSAKKK